MNRLSDIIKRYSMPVKNIVVFIEPRTQTKVRDYLQVNVRYIDVKNTNIYRPYIKDGQG